MATIASLLVNILGDSTQLNKSLKDATDKMQSFADSATSIGKTLSTRLTLPIVGAGALMVRSFTVQEDAVARMNAALQANGGQANITANEIENLASQLQKVTTFGDEATISSAALLLTFHQIRNEAGKGNDVFNRTIKASQDLASAMGTDLRSATMQLAKALENPTIGLGALSRSGTTFTEQQKEMIQTLVESGRQLEAQTMILDVVESQYSGIAEAMRKTTSGTIKAALNELSDEMEKFGKIISEALIPFIGGIVKALGHISRLDEGTKRFIVTLSALVAGIGPVVYGVGLLTSGIRALTIAIATNPYFAFALALTGIATATYSVLKGVSDLNKAYMSHLGLGEKITGSQEEQATLLAKIVEISKDLTRQEDLKAKAVMRGSQIGVQSAQANIDRLNDQHKAVQQLYQQSVLLGSVAQDGVFKEKDVENTRAMAYELRTVNTQLQMLDENLRDDFAPRISLMSDAWVEFGDMVEYANRSLESIGGKLENIFAKPKNLEDVNAQIREYQKLLATASTQEQRESIQATITDLQRMGTVMGTLTSLADTFTSSFGAGMANVVVHGEKLKDILRNIGNLMASAAIQTAIKLLLTGGAGFGVAGGGTGLVGFLTGLVPNLFGFNKQMSGVAPAVAQSASLTLDGQFQIKGTDLIYVMNRAERSLR